MWLKQGKVVYEMRQGKEEKKRMQTHGLERYDENQKIIHEDQQKNFFFVYFNLEESFQSSCQDYFHDLTCLVSLTHFTFDVMNLFSTLSFSKPCSRQREYENEFQCSIFLYLTNPPDKKTTIYLSHINVSYHAVIQDTSINQPFFNPGRVFYISTKKKLLR